MKSIVVPSGLLRLPLPWCLTSNNRRNEQIQALPSGRDEIKTALEVLDQSLTVFSLLTLPEGESIPEEINDNWNFSTEWIARKIPTLDEFDIFKIQEFLKENGVEFPREQMIEEVAESWLWSITRDIADASSAWLKEVLRVSQDRVCISSFLDIVARHWQKNEHSLAGSLLLRSAAIAKKDALPLLESVETTSASSALKEEAQSYRNWILNLTPILPVERRERAVSNCYYQ